MRRINASRLLKPVLGLLACSALALGAWAAPQLALAEQPGGGRSPEALTADAMPEDVTWNFDLATADGLPTLEGETGEYEGISIDATNGKFSPRENDTQINAGTVLTIPVDPSLAGATLTVTPSGDTAKFTAKIGEDDSSYEATMSSPAQVVVDASGGDVILSFTGQSYLKTIVLTYSEPAEEFPGTPESVEAKDVTWDLTVPAEGASTIQSATGEYEGLKVDATSGKFDPLATYTQVNAGTIVYVPVAASEGGATLLVSGNDNNGQVQLRVDNSDSLSSFGDLIEVDVSATRYVKIEFVGEGSVSSNVFSISVDYAADTSTYPGTPEGVTATDRTWDLTQGGATIERARGAHEGILVDALAGGKFAPRDDESGHNTQVNGGTTLYVPVAADEKGAVLRIEGTNNGNLDITVDGEPAQLGTDIALTTAEARYVSITFAGEGSCYLTSISVDYVFDSAESAHVVTVGPNGDYQTISAALADNDSSLKDHLVISIAPGSYNERVVIDKPGVILQNADETGEHEVIIHASYFSGNVWDAEGHYVPQDPIYDLGTDQCATVLVEAAATGFSARGITFQNDYNTVDHVAEGEQTPAVAFNSKADRVDLVDCSFIGRQDTLYVQGPSNRVYLKDCYVEGTVDFVFGDADAYFDGCTLHMAAFPGRDSGYYTAANTKSGYTGLVFFGCTFTADPSLTDVSLGRPWQNLCFYSTTTHDAEGHTIYHDIDTSRQHSQYANVSSAVTLIGCTTPATLNPARWDRWTGRNESGETVSVTYDGSVRFAEYGSRNPDGTPAAPSTDDSLTFVTFEPDANTAAIAAEKLAAMKIGAPYWQPADLEFADDGGFWQEGGETPGEELPDSGEDEVPSGEDEVPSGEDEAPSGEDDASEETTPEKPSVSPQPDEGTSASPDGFDDLADVTTPAVTPAGENDDEAAERDGLAETDGEAAERDGLAETGDATSLAAPLACLVTSAGALLAAGMVRRRSR